MATYKHLRSSTANKRPTTSIADGQLAINTNTASPGLFFKDSAGTGIVKVGPVHVGTTAPNVSPAAGGSSGNYTGEQWLDTSVSPNQMKVWNGSAWVGIVADELPVSKLQDGIAGQIVQTDSAGTGVEWSSTTNLPIGSAGAPAYSFQSDSNTGIYSPGADQVAISTAGTGRLFVASDGKVGIGTTSPIGKVDITGTNIPLILQSTVAAANYIAHRHVTSGDIGYIGNGGGGALTGGTTSDYVIRANLGSLIFACNGDNERARIDSSGRLLVGTSSARTKWFNLTLTGPLIQTESNSNQMGVSSTYTANDASGPIIALGKTRGSLYEVVSSGDDAGVITFQGGDGAEMVEAARITAQIDGTPGANDMPGRLVFSTTADGAASPTERMRITQNGRIAFGGQGAPYANATCDTYNNESGEFAHAFRQDNATGFGIGIGIDGTYLAYFYPNKDLSGAPVGSISQNGTATAYNTSSDYRLKENINAVTDGIARLQQLKPSRFNFIADPYKTVDGFIAHEVQAVVPEAINGEKDAVDDNGNPIYQGIDQSKLVPLLTAALQEAIGRIETLEAEVAALKAQ